MTEDEDKTIEIEVHDDPVVEVEAPPGAETKAPKTEKKVAPSADDGIAELKASLAAKTREAAEAQGRVSDLDRGMGNAQMQIWDAQRNQIASATEAITRDVQISKKELADAYAAGNFDKAADIQFTISQSASRLLQLENGKAAIEAAIKRGPQAPAQQQVRQPPDPVAEYTKGMAPQSRDWLRAHPEYLTDQRLHARMMSAHHDAVAEGYQPDSKPYFSHIENRLGLNEEPAHGRSVDAVPQPAQRAAPVSAPVSRVPVGANGRSAPTRINLTKEEQEFASMCGLSNEDYARSKAAEIRAGNLRNN